MTVSRVHCEMFQFQTGSIKSRVSDFTRLRAAEFQFQTGSIKSRFIVPFDMAPIPQFQFQTGSIKRTVIFFMTSIIRVSIPNWFD